jgi:hypothetical protein
MLSKVMATDELLLSTAVYQIDHFVVPIIRCQLNILKPKGKYTILDVL